MSLLARSVWWVREARARVGVHRIPDGVLPADLGRELEEFERRFVRRFGDVPDHVRIHAERFTNQYRSIGPARCLCARTGSGNLSGTLCLARTRLRFPSGIVRRAVYGTNLLVAPEARHGPTLARLMGAAVRWTAPRAWAGFAHVPEGSTSRPERFMRQLGLPAFAEVGAIRIVSLPTGHADDAALVETEMIDEPRVRRMRRHLMRGCIVAEGGDPAARSGRAPVWIALRDGSACACIEDCDRTKRHERVGGSGPLEWCHLSFLGFRDAAAFGRIARAGLAIAHQRGVPLMQVAVDAAQERDLLDAAGVPPAFGFRARIAGFAVGGFPRAPWSLNASEI